jgi:cyclopropane fatty-acyl-phospholipid synthase-like methyltransferase
MPPAGASGSRKAHKITAQKLIPHFANVQAHYDLSDDFFRLFLDVTHTYNCAYFEREDMTLARHDVARRRLRLGPPCAGRSRSKTSTSSV